MGTNSAGGATLSISRHLLTPPPRIRNKFATLPSTFALWNRLLATFPSSRRPSSDDHLLSISLAATWSTLNSGDTDWSCKNGKVVIKLIAQSFIKISLFTHIKVQFTEHILWAALFDDFDESPGIAVALGELYQVVCYCFRPLQRQSIYLHLFVQPLPV